LWLCLSSLANCDRDLSTTGRTRAAIYGGTYTVYRWYNNADPEEEEIAFVRIPCAMVTTTGKPTRNKHSEFDLNWIWSSSLNRLNLPSRYMLAAEEIKLCPQISTACINCRNFRRRTNEFYWLLLQHWPCIY
jgi:hypothetical protein